MSEFVETRLSCPACGSSDARAVNSDGWSTCFSCHERTPPDGETPERTERKSVSKTPLITGEAAGVAVDLAGRKLYADTLRKFGYTRGEYDGEVCQIAPYHDAKGRLVAQKVRLKGKRFLITGNMGEATLFGQHLWSGSKARAEWTTRLVITEGEVDTLSYAQATGLKWPVVSVPTGAPSAVKAIRNNIEFVEQFDEVVFLFDNDEPGQEGAQKCAEVLTPGKAKIATLPLKDANDMLKAGRVKELLSAVYDARSVRPDGVVNGDTLWDAVSTPVEMGTPYPWAPLNDKLYGLRRREIVTFTAGSGIGKSAVVREIAYHLGNTLNENVGLIELEAGNDRTGLALMGIHGSVPLHLPEYDVSPEERQRLFDETLGTGHYWLYDHFGSLDADNLLNKLRYMVIACDCKWLILDHLSIVVSGLDPDEDERRAIDRTMTRLRQFTEETNVGLILVSHLKRPNGVGHEDGANTSLAQLRGSAAIAQLSDAVVGLERNQQSDDSDERNITQLRVLKNRYVGLTGPAGSLVYDGDTGRLTEGAVVDASEGFDEL